MLITFRRDPRGGMGFCLYDAVEATQFSPDCQISGVQKEVGQPLGLNSEGSWDSSPGMG